MFIRIKVSPFALLILGLSTILCFLINSWLSIWVMLEINTLSFCYLIKSHSTKKKQVTEASMKYFIIQSISSSILIFSMVSFKFQTGATKGLIIFGVIALIIKMASSPFHQWFVNILKISENWNRTLLMTWQKLAPVFLVIYQSKAFIYPFMVLSVVVGCLSQINKITFVEMIGFSSIFNLRWILLAISVNRKLLIGFSVIYWTSVVIVIFIITKSQISKINTENLKITKKFVYFTVMINLAGIPPLAGFLAKWLVFREALKTNITTLVTVLLTIRSINLFIYLRFINLILTKTSVKKQKRYKEAKPSVIKRIMIVNLLPLAIVAFYRKRLKKGLFW